jgi:hypothetical protein
MSNSKKSFFEANTKPIGESSFTLIVIVDTTFPAFVFAGESTIDGAAEMEDCGTHSVRFSMFFNSLAPETGLMGHSMGGGASFKSAENN